MGDELGKYHSEKSDAAPTGSAADSPNPQMDVKPGHPQNLVVPSMGNPMMNMSGGKPVPGGHGETDSGNPMMGMSGGPGNSNVPGKSEVMSSQGPQSSKKAPLAGKLLKDR